MITPLKKIKIELTDGNIAFEFDSADGHVLDYNNMARKEQIKVLNALAQGYHLFKKHLKTE